MTHPATLLAIAIASALVPMASPSAAQPVSRPGPPVVTMTLSNFHFSPDQIHLVAGQPVVLRLINSGGGGHDFTAPEFFARSTIDPADRAIIDRGRVRLARGEQKILHLVPVAGRYRLKCSHAFHSMLGMTGAIVVD